MTKREQEDTDTKVYFDRHAETASFGHYGRILRGEHCDL